MKVIGYSRCSSDEQVQNGQSLDVQREKIEAYCKLYDLALVEIVIDAGVSAKNLKREGLQRALVQMSTEATGLVICKLDRLTRSVADWQKLIDDYFGDNCGFELFSVGDSIDTRTAAGRLVLNVLLSVSQWEREIISERTKEALQHKIARGERCGRIPYGYDLAEDAVTLVANVTEQIAIALMHRLRSEGKSLPEICKNLIQCDYRTKNGGEWFPTTISNILNRTAAVNCKSESLTK